MQSDIGLWRLLFDSEHRHSLKCEIKLAATTPVDSNFLQADKHSSFVGTTNVLSPILLYMHNVSHTLSKMKRQWMNGWINGPIIDGPFRLALYVTFRTRGIKLI